MKGAVVIVIVMFFICYFLIICYLSFFCLICIVCCRQGDDAEPRGAVRAAGGVAEEVGHHHVPALRPAQRPQLAHRHARQREHHRRREPGVEGTRLTSSTLLHNISWS